MLTIILAFNSLKSKHLTTVLKKKKKEKCHLMRWFSYLGNNFVQGIL